jgi:hypothetical protein
MSSDRPSPAHVNGGGEADKMPVKRTRVYRAVSPHHRVQSRSIDILMLIGGVCSVILVAIKGFATYLCPSDFHKGPGAVLTTLSYY